MIPFLNNRNEKAADTFVNSLNSAKLAEFFLSFKRRIHTLHSRFYENIHNTISGLYMILHHYPCILNKNGIQ